MGVVRSLAWFGVLAIASMGIGCGDDDGNGNGGPQDATTQDVPAAAVCGNGIVEEGEDCDNGTAANLPGSGCEPDCTFTCRSDAECDDGNPCNGEERCSTSLHRCQAGTPLEDGAECTLMLPAPPDGDAGVPDGGAADAGEDDPELVETDAVCIAQVCARPCETDDECSDGDPCNGEETCNEEYAVNGCQPGEPPECDDGLECTISSCDPEENPETGCLHVLIDEDGDGYAPEHLDCDERGGDCDDSDPNINPGADRICGDGIDNNCLGHTDDPEAPIWYQDCDGDTYAAAGAVTQQQCAKPATTVECLDWTQRTPTGLSNTDCDDSNPGVYPGARNSTNNGWYTRPYCRGTGQLATGSAGSFTCSGVGGTLSWDYDCDGESVRRYTNVNYSTSGSCVYNFGFSTTSNTTAESDGLEEASAGGATHKSSLMSEYDETGLIIIPCDDCVNWCHTGGGYTAGWAPSCGFSAEYRQCAGTQTCSCYGCDCTCNSSLSQRMQECR
jgi:hypothetical protein